MLSMVCPNKPFFSSFFVDARLVAAGIAVLVFAAAVLLWVHSSSRGSGEGLSNLVFVRVRVLHAGMPLPNATVMLQDGGTHLTGRDGSTIFVLDANRCYLGWIFARGYSQKRISICTGDSNESMEFMINRG